MSLDKSKGLGASQRGVWLRLLCLLRNQFKEQTKALIVCPKKKKGGITFRLCHLATV